MTLPGVSTALCKRIQSHPQLQGTWDISTDASKLNSGTISSIIGDSLITPDPNTIEIKVSQPVAFFLDTLAEPVAYPVEQSLIEKYGSNWTDHLQEGGGDGPFKVKNYVHQKELDIVPNPNYYGPQPQLKEVIFPFYKQQDATYSDYLANKLDDTAIPLANLDQAKSRPDYVHFPILATNYYTMNYKQKPFDNIHIRQAFALAINKQKIVDKIWKGLFIATNHIIPQGMPGYNPDLKGPDGTTNLTGNPKKAQQLLQQGLKEEGWSSISQIPPITLTYSSCWYPGCKRRGDRTAPRMEGRTQYYSQRKRHRSQYHCLMMHQRVLTIPCHSTLLAGLLTTRTHRIGRPCYLIRISSKWYELSGRIIVLTQLNSRPCRFAWKTPTSCRIKTSVQGVPRY